jgi:hypothetical protein
MSHRRKKHTKKFRRSSFNKAETGAEAWLQDDPDKMEKSEKGM